MVDLSEQNIVDCTTNKTVYGNNGCYGGSMLQSYNYVVINKGIDTTKSYPYLSGSSKQQGTTCKYNTSGFGASISKFVVLPSDELSLKTAVATIGPVSVSGGWIWY